MVEILFFIFCCYSVSVFNLRRKKIVEKTEITKSFLVQTKLLLIVQYKDFEICN